MLVQEFLEKSARKLAGKEALVAGETRLTYGELDEASNRFARALRAGGVQYGDRVAVLMDNVAEAVTSIWGILKAGAVFLVINPTTKAPKISYILNNCRASALATGGSLIATIVGGSSTLGLAGLAFSQGLSGSWWLLVGVATPAAHHKLPRRNTHQFQLQFVAHAQHVTSPTRHIVEKDKGRYRAFPISVEGAIQIIATDA